MNIFKSKPGIERIIILLIGIFSVFSISTTYILASQTLYLPLVFQNNQASAATATATTTPRPPETQYLMVTPSNPDKAWALASFAKSYNSAGRPVMQIYPGDSSPDSERIKIPRGEVVLALKNVVTADGGGKYWQLVEIKGRAGETLFLKATDVTKVFPEEPEN